MSAPPETRALTPGELRCTWALRQRLGRTSEPALDVVRDCGWLSSPGGAGPYLAVRARNPQVHRASLDDLVFEREELREVSTVRGAAMLVPAGDVPLALGAGKRANDERFARVARQCGVSTREIDRLTTLTVEALRGGPATAEALRARFPPDAVRDLGPAGRKLGESTTLPMALRELLMAGVVVRRSETKRLDDPRFAWALARPSVRPVGPAECVPLLAEVFLRWAAPATVEDFSWWAGIPKRAAKEAFETVGARGVRVQGEQELRFETDQAGSADDGGVSFLPFRDNLLSLHRGLGPFLDGSPVEVLDWMNRKISAAKAESLHQNAIVAGGRLIGVWEFDPEPREVAWKLWDSTPVRLRRDAASEAAFLQDFIREELGDARYYPFDTARTRQPRIAFARG